MIVDERMVTYIRSLERPENPVIEAIEQEALESFVPIIRKETQSFLKVMMLMNRPARVLEVGTAVGFSAILMSEYLPEGSRITTIENYEKRIPIARNNFKRAGKEEQITLIEGDALEVMKTLEGPYDFIFMDAAKGQYIHYMPEAVRLLADGGILMSDNVLQDGDIIESRFAVERRNRTIHSRMRDYLYELKHSNVLETSIIPLGDGVALSIKKKKEEKQTSRITDSCKQSGSVEDCGYVWCRCSIYRRRGIWTSCKGKEFLYGRHERRRAVCA